MPARLQCPRRREQKRDGVRVQNRFLKPDRTQAEYVAQKHHDELHQHD